MQACDNKHIVSWGCTVRATVASLTAASFKQVGGSICGPMCGLTQGPGPGPGTSISGATHSASTRVTIRLADWLHVVLGCVGVVGGIGGGTGQSGAEWS